ncbi:MAG: sodium:proton antiporter, partial [Alphaproteobacteria bacterium]|nr:sodium:proton antiporter [Alphaproteobacteria bacterium]
MMRAFPFLSSFVLAALALPGVPLASDGAGHQPLDLTAHGVGIAAIVTFMVAYALVMAEEVTHLRKSKPVILAAGIIWMMIGYVYTTNGMGEMAEQAVRHNIL